MEIAILTMQRIVNMGSVLQAYSLRNMIEETTGERAVFLDIEDEPALPSRKSTKESVDYAAKAAYSRTVLQRGKRWVIARLSRLTKKKIRRFMETELHLTADNSHREYDVVVIGSDEVFNHAKGVRLQLHGAVKQAQRVITYAASCGNAQIEDVDEIGRAQICRAMGRIAALSVRDAATQAYVAPVYHGDTLRHLDPVLAGNLHKRPAKKVWLKKYLLVYAYGQRIRTEEEIQAIRRFAKERGLKTVAIGGSQFWCNLYLPVSPFRALDYFHYADYVVTDTFHGAIFSVIHHKQFAVLPRLTNKGKITSLLEDLGLESRLVETINTLPQTLEETIQYDKVEQILNKERTRAREYLATHLKG